MKSSGKSLLPLGAKFRLSRLSAFMTAGLLFAAPVVAQPVNVITVDCTPFVSPGLGSFGPTNTMGMALQAVDQGGDFNVTEVTPAAFRALTAAQLSAFDLIAVNNHPARLGDACVPGAGGGLGTTWHSVVGVVSGSRVLLTSHDAPRFKLLRTPPAPPLFTGFEPFGTVDFVRQAALWAGGVPGQTGLLIFNDAARFFLGVGGQGWDNPELNLPAAWEITDLDQSGGFWMNGGYTDILPAFQNHPIYDGTAVGGVVLSDVRGAPFSLSSFSANIADTSFHSVFGSFDASILKPTEVVVNAGIVDVDGLCPCSGNPAAGPDGSAITLIRENAPPDCSGALADPDLFWPPNHKFLEVAVLGVTDPDGDPVSITISGISQDEPVEGLGDGNTCPDADGIGAELALVRAERIGTKKAPGDGRVYHINFTADDGQGGECSGTVAVCVPHDQGGGNTCVDGGPIFDSTVCEG